MKGSEAKPIPKPVSDNPIVSKEQDSLGRLPAATAFAEQILGIDSSKGCVVGVMGQWGSGKTSFTNLMRESFLEKGTTVIDFNPWLFSGAEQLVGSFFSEIAAQLKVKPSLVEVGEAIEEYGEIFAGLIWVPVIGPWIERTRMAGKLFGKLLGRRKEGVGKYRNKIDRVLKTCASPIIIVLDDIDRLTSSEIRDIFKLIRLTANFPNIIYLVAFDRKRVESALNSEEIPGRDYLEKIMQLAFDLPEVPEEVMDQQIFAAIDQVMVATGIDFEANFKNEAWPDVFYEIVRPLIRNMRDVNRYSLALMGTVKALGTRIQLVDLLAMEAIRVFLPDVYYTIRKSIAGLTQPGSDGLGGERESEELKNQVQEVVSAGESNAPIVKALIKRLMPAGERHLGGMSYGDSFQIEWARNHRIAHVDFLNLYYERVSGSGLRSFEVAELAFGTMGERSELEALFESVPTSQIPDAITRLESFERQYGSEHVVPSSIVLLNMLNTLPEGQRGFFGFDNRTKIGRVVYRLLKACSGPEEVEKAVEEILPELDGLYTKDQLITIVGYRENAGHKLVSEEYAEDIQKRWREDVRNTTKTDLLKEPDLLRILLDYQDELEEGEAPFALYEDPEIVRALVTSATTESQSQSMGSRAVRKRKRLGWKSLVYLYGEEAKLVSAVQQMVEHFKDPEDEIMTLAGKHATGWSPDKFDDD